MPATLKVTAAPGLLSGQFREDTVHVREGHWTDLDADDPKNRKVLITRTPRHIRIALGQEAALSAAGLAMDGMKLVDARAITTKKESPKAK